MNMIRVPYNYRQGHNTGSARKLPVFIGARRQRGGGILGSVFRTIGRLAMPALKYLFPTMKAVAGDVMSGRNIKQSIVDHGSKALIGAVHKGVDAAGNIIKKRATERIRAKSTQKGQGVKRKKSTSKPPAKKRKTTKKPKTKKKPKKTVKKQTGGSKKKKKTTKRKPTKKKKQTGGNNYLF